MALFFADLVREASWDAGTGSLTLGGALPGHRRFADVVPPAARFHYCIAGVAKPDEWETGEGAIDDDGRLVRSPLASSAGDQPVDFSSGLKTVSLTVAAAWYADIEDHGGVDPELIAEAIAGKADLSGAAFSGPLSAPGLSLGADLAVSEGGTGASTAAGARANLGIVPGIDVEPHHPALTALAALDDQSGLIEQVAANDFVKREIGVGSPSALPTRSDADARYQPLDPDLSAIAAGATTGFGRALLAETDAASLRTTAGLGTAATRNTGTSGTNVPLLDGANTWSSQQLFSGGARLSNNVSLYGTNSSGAQFRAFLPHSSNVFYMGAVDAGMNTVVIRAGGSDIATITTSGLAVTGTGAVTATGTGTGTLTLAGGSGGGSNVSQLSFERIGSGEVARIEAQRSGGNNSGALLFSTANAGSLAEAARISAAGIFTYGGLEIGYRDLPRVTGGIERGKCFATSSGVTINAGTAGSVCSIYNDSGSSITLSQGTGLTLRLGGSASTGNRTLAARGFATLWFNSATEAIVTGSGVS